MLQNHSARPNCSRDCVLPSVKRDQPKKFPCSSAATWLSTLRRMLSCVPGMKSNSPQLNTRSFDYSFGIRDLFSPIATFFAKSGDQNRRNIDSICASMSRTCDKRLNPILQIQVSSLPSQALATALFRQIDRWICLRPRSLHGPLLRQLPDHLGRFSADTGAENRDFSRD